MEHETCIVPNCGCACDACVSDDRPICCDACHDTCCKTHINCECPTAHIERPTMPTLTKTVLVWHQCQLCMATINKKRPAPAEVGLDKALRHVRDVHGVHYPDSLAVVSEHRVKA